MATLGQRRKADVSESGEDHWFEGIADHLGSSYLRYSFTMGTADEVAFLIEELELKPGMRVLDVGCGPGRHAYALAELGIAVHGIDISQTFIDLAREDAPALATFERLDARSLRFDAEFDAVISLCQGAFGLAGGAAAAGHGPSPPEAVLPCPPFLPISRCTGWKTPIRSMPMPGSTTNWRP
jgi:SAM-dependent methyltransferase